MKSETVWLPPEVVREAEKTAERSRRAFEEAERNPFPLPEPMPVGEVLTVLSAYPDEVLLERADGRIVSIRAEGCGCSCCRRAELSIG